MFKAFKASRFKKEIEEALASGVLSAEKLDYLKQRSDELGLTRQFLHDQRQQDFLRRTQPIINGIVASRRFSPDDEAKLKKLASDLHVTASFDHEYKQFRTLWEYDNTGNISLTPVECSINLTKDEQCFFQALAKWKQLKTVREYKGYSGVAVSFRVAKGVRLYSGRSAPRYIQHEEMGLVSSGRLYISNKRLVFSGEKKSTTTTYSKVIDIKEYSDGLEIIKAIGRPDYYLMTGLDTEFASITIRQLLSE
jgi:hypothetical protein